MVNQPNPHHMRVQVNGRSYRLDLSEKDYDTVKGEILAAMNSKTTVAVEVLDKHDRQLTLLLNGAALEMAKLDPGLGAKPSEIGP